MGPADLGSSPSIRSQGEASASQTSSLARWLLDGYSDVDDYHYYKCDYNNFNDNVEDASNYHAGDNTKNDGAHECAILDSGNEASITLDGGNKTSMTLYKAGTYDNGGNETSMDDNGGNKAGSANHDYSPNNTT